MSVSALSNLGWFAVALTRAAEAGGNDAVSGAHTTAPEAFAAWLESNTAPGWFGSFPEPQQAAIRDAYERQWMHWFARRYLMAEPANMNSIRRVD